MNTEPALASRPEELTLTRPSKIPMIARAGRLGRTRPYAPARCTCKEGYSNWHMLAAGLLDSDSALDFLTKASREPAEVLTADIWEHTWEGENFPLFRSLFFGDDAGSLSEEEQKEILLGRTPAELAFLADREFPVCGEDRESIPACVSVQRWVEILRRSQAQA